MTAGVAWAVASASLLVLLYAPPAAAETFVAPNIRVDDSMTDAQNEFDPALASTLGVMGAIFYMSYTNDSLGDDDIWFARSFDNGLTWGGWVNVSDDVPGNGNLQEDSDIAVAADGTIYVVWTHNPGGANNNHIRIAWSTDAGASWGASVQVDDAAGQDADSPTMAILSNGTMVVAWRDFSGGQDIRASYSLDGLTWSASVEVNDVGGGNKQNPDAGAAGSLVHLVWFDQRTDGDIFHSSWNGTAWSVNHRVDDDTTAARARDPALLVGVGGNASLLAVAYSDDRDPVNGDDEVRFTNSSDGGVTWGDGVTDNDPQISDPTNTVAGNLARFPAIAEVNATILVAWRDDAWTDPNLIDDDVLGAASSNGGLNWTSPARVNDDQSGSTFAQDEVALAGGLTTAVAVYHTDHEGNDDVGASWTTNGTVWGDGYMDDDDPIAAGWGTSVGGDQSEPQVVDYGGSFYAIWTDTRDNHWGAVNADTNIYFSSAANGSVWGDGVLNNNDVRVDDGTTETATPAYAISNSPDLAVSSTGRLYAVYSDNRNGDYDVLATWSDDGIHWGDGHINGNDVRVNGDAIGNGFGQFEPVVAVAPNGTVYAAWEDARGGVTTDIYLGVSLDDGLTWANYGPVNDDGLAVNQYNPAIAVTGTMVYVVWEDYRNMTAGTPDIYFSSSADGGATWNANVRVNDDAMLPAQAEQTRPSIAVATSGEIGVIWVDNRNGATAPDIYSSASLDGGLSWGDGIGNNNDLVVNDVAAAVGQGGPSLAADTAVYAVFHDDRTTANNDIFFSKFTGFFWSTPNDQVNDPAFQGSLQDSSELTLEPLTVNVIWRDARLGANNVWFTMAARQEPSSNQLDHIELTPWPGPTNLMVGNSQTYTAFGINQDGSTNLTWTPSWGTTDARGTVGNFGGSAATGYTADYAANTPGLDNITVAATGVLGIANSSLINISAPAVGAYLASIELTPWPSVTLGVTATQGFTAFGYNNDTSLNTTWVSNWTTTSGTGITATGGSAAAGWNATFTAGTVAGRDNITVQDNATLVSNTTMITIEPGPLFMLRIDPWPGPTPVPSGGTLSYSAWGLDQYGNINQTWGPPTWGTTNALGLVTPTGGDPVNGYTADYVAGPTAGFDNITATDLGTGATNQSLINVTGAPSNDPLQWIELTPWPSVTLAVAGSQGFTALGYSQSGLQNFTWNASWSATGGTVPVTGGDAITGFTATYAAGTVAGVFDITVSNGSVSNTTAITLTPGPLAAIELSPWPLVYTQVGLSRTFTALAYDQYGNQNTTWGPPTWTPGALGSIGVTGGNPNTGYTASFVAGTLPGSSSITAAEGLLSNSTTIEIDPGPLDHIDVTPAGPVQVTLGAVQSFSALGYDQFNNQNLTWSATWLAVNARGTVTNQGGSAPAGFTADYTATVLGADVLRVSDAGVQTDVQITNVAPPPPPLARIELTPWPGTITVPSGTAASFTALGYNTDDTVNTTWTATWSTTNGRGTMGNFGGTAATGFTADYTAGAIAGSDNAVVTAVGLPGIANQTSVLVTVTAAADPLIRIELTPGPSLTLEIGDARTFLARGFDQSGALNTTWVPLWNLTGAIGTLGSFNEPAPGNHTALFTATALGAGTLRVTATGLPAVGNTTELSVVDLTPPVSQVNALPARTNTLALSLTYTASDAGGSGLLEVEIWYRLDSGTWTLHSTVTPWTTPTVAFTATGPGTWDFYSVARDNATNEELPPPAYDTRTVIDTVPPTVSGSQPTNEATDIPTNAVVTITFSEPMDQTSVQNAITVTADGQAVIGTWTFSGNTATFTPSDPLPAGAVVTVSIDGSLARDIAGNSLGANQEFSFTVEETTGGSPPGTFPWLLVIGLILGVLAVLLLLLFLLRRRKKEEPTVGPEGAVPPPEQAPPPPEGFPPPVEEIPPPPPQGEASPMEALPPPPPA